MSLKEESKKAGLILNLQKLKSWHPVPSLYGKQMGKKWKQCQTLFSWGPKSLQMVTAAMKLKEAAPWRKGYDEPRQNIKQQRHHFTDKGLYNPNYGFPAIIYKCESWTIKKANHLKN